MLSRLQASLWRSSEKDSQKPNSHRKRRQQTEKQEHPRTRRGRKAPP
jgi:hypothetical protein